MNAVKFSFRRAPSSLAPVVFLATLVLVSMSSLQGQITSSIRGTVSEQTGGVIPGVEVSVTNPETNEKRTTTTNDVGYYSFPALPPGQYEVRAEMPGFKTWTQKGVALSLNRNARIDIKLEIGELVQELVVQSDAPLVETTTSELGAVVDQKKITQLPILGRNTLSLVSLVPGSQGLQEGNAQGFLENKVSINGARPEDSNWLLDGGDNTSTLRNYGNVVPNPDAIQEFRVITNNYDAEYGRTAGAVVNVVTRSGSNSFHGSLFEFHRNRALNARDFFRSDKTPLVQNQFGFTLGGPVIKDKTFFFTSYQGFRRRVSSFENSPRVPTALERQGDFSQSVDEDGKLMIIKDPLTGLPFPDNKIPTARLSKVAQGYLDRAIALPNNPAEGPNALIQTASEPNDNDQFLLKIDHQFSPAHKLTGAYFMTDASDLGRFLTEIDFASRNIMSRQTNINLHEYWTLDSTKLNHFHATVARSAGDRKVMPDDVSMADFGSNFLPLPDGPQMPPDVEVEGWFEAGSAYGGPKTADHYTLADDFSWMMGHHDLKFGAETWLRKLMDVSTHGRMGGSWVFNGDYTDNPAADLMLGLVNELEVQNESYKSLNSWSFNWYIQDKFQVTPRLALNLGLRYENTTWPTHPYDAIKVFLPGQQSTVAPQAPQGIVFAGDNGIPRSGMRADNNNFAPRLGMAWDPLGDGRTSVRAGFGISYSFALFNALQNAQAGTPFGLQTTIRDTTLEDPYAPIGGNPFPFVQQMSDLAFPAGATYAFQDYNLRTPYIQQFNLSVQRQLRQDWMVELAYVGSGGRKLINSYDVNAAVRAPNATSKNIAARRPLGAGFGEVAFVSSFVNSSYHALQARVEKRFNRGLSLLGSYAFGKALDMSSWYNSGNEWVDSYNLSLNKGRGDADIRHILRVSWLWQIPFERQGVLGAIASGWWINGIGTLQSGSPVWIQRGTDADYDGHTGDRPNLVGDWKLDPDRPRGEVINAWFDKTAFAAPAAGKVGDLGRNVVEGPGLKNVDLTLAKDFGIREGHALQFRLESANAFNLVNLSNPENRFNRATFGSIESTRGSRILQVGLKYSF
ncbi:MAG: TonB-dependent receptor [Acidobacteria bacterium]|nr:MAG: TonB-dependent receptor [Acidobacteriota bacterium]